MEANSLKTNCLGEVLFDEALSRARELDAYYEQYHKPNGPLHGLPISLKDQFRVSGIETSLGYISWLGKKENEGTESWLVSKLRSLGAVFYCKTNVPTSLMVWLYSAQACSRSSLSQNPKCLVRP